MSMKRYVIIFENHRRFLNKKVMWVVFFRGRLGRKYFTMSAWKFMGIWASKEKIFLPFLPYILHWRNSSLVHIADYDYLSKTVFRSPSGMAISWSYVRPKFSILWNKDFIPHFWFASFLYKLPQVTTGYHRLPQFCKI